MIAIFKTADTDGSLSQDRVSTWNWMACHGVFGHQPNRDRSNFGAILHPSVVVIIVKESLMKRSRTGEPGEDGCAIRAVRVDNAAEKLR
jgi:hypothetical protein